MMEKPIAEKHHATLEGLRRLEEEGDPAGYRSGRESEDHFEDALEMVKNRPRSETSDCRSGPCPRK
jgi:hypothetical protein